MTAYAFIRNNIAIEVMTTDSFVDVNGVLRAAGWYTTASASDIATAGLVAITESTQTVPVGSEITGTALQVSNGQDYCCHTTS